MVSHHYRTEYNRQRRLITRIKDMYSGAKIYRSTQKQFLEARQRLWDSPDWKRAVGHVQHYCNGYIDCLGDHRDYHDLQHMYWYLGQWRSHDTLKTIFDLLNKGWSEVADAPSGLFWKTPVEWRPHQPWAPYFLGADEERCCPICYSCTHNNPYICTYCIAELHKHPCGH